jgi:hypothetical protein
MGVKGMRIYVIRRSSRGIVHCTVQNINGGKPAGAAYRLPHANLHSPTGFECGYGGSGPADLAASILADFFNVNPRAVAAAYRGKLRFAKKPMPADVGKVFHLHQDFKFDVIAGIHLGKGEKREIPAELVAEWVAKKTAAMAAEE